jgi:hypothetical protein
MFINKVRQLLALDTLYLHYYTTRITRWLMQYIELQLFITLLSLPILAQWGITWSGLSFIGNLIFGPLLTLFLALCTTMFFAHILDIPYEWIAHGADNTLKLWQWCGNVFPISHYVGWANPPAWLLLGAPLTAGIIMHLHVLRYRRVLRVALLCTITIFIVLYGSVYRPAVGTIVPITVQPGKQLQIIVHDHGCSLIDTNKSFCQKTVTASWLRYTLLSEIARSTGAVKLKHIIVIDPTPKSYQQIAALASFIDIECIWIIKSDYQSDFIKLKFEELVTIARQRNIQLECIEKSGTIFLDPYSHISIQQRYHKISDPYLKKHATKLYIRENIITF